MTNNAPFCSNAFCSLHGVEVPDFATEVALMPTVDFSRHLLEPLGTEVAGVVKRRRRVPRGEPTAGFWMCEDCIKADSDGLASALKNVCLVVSPLICDAVRQVDESFGWSFEPDRYQPDSAVLHLTKVVEGEVYNMRRAICMTELYRRATVADPWAEIGHPLYMIALDTAKCLVAYDAYDPTRVATPW